MTTPQEPQTADGYIMEHLGKMFESLKSEFDAVNRQGAESGLHLDVQNIKLTFEGASRDALVAEAEQETGTKAELFQPGVNPSFTSDCGTITIAFK